MSSAPWISPSPEEPTNLVSGAVDMLVDERSRLVEWAGLVPAKLSCSHSRVLLRDRELSGADRCILPLEFELRLTNRVSLRELSYGSLECPDLLGLSGREDGLRVEHAFQRVDELSKGLDLGLLGLQLRLCSRELPLCRSELPPLDPYPIGCNQSGSKRGQRYGQRDWVDHIPVARARGA